MGIIELNATSCKNCYKCIRECPIKSIAFKDDQAKIIDEECILCGTCVINCPQNAKYIRDDVKRVKELIEKGERVFFSVAPSWKAWYNTDFSKLSRALKKFGAEAVEETAIGANVVSREYERLMAEKKSDNIIATACSSVVLLIEKKFPKLVKYLAPVSSPMMAHAKLMKRAYGDDIKVVFLGPCYSKKSEAEDGLSGGDVTYAVTFANMDEQLKKAGIEFSENDEFAVGVLDSASRLYPKPSGILATIPEKKFNGYIKVSCDGEANCLDAFKALSSGEMSGVFLEANICSGGCVGGPVFRVAQRNLLKAVCAIDGKRINLDDNPADSAKQHASYKRSFSDSAKTLKKPTEAQIREILLKTGKTKKSDELNCGCCGYTTCREKAEAVFYGKADINMCVPFFRSRAESVSNTVIEHSPNGIIVFGDDECVIDLNPKAEAMFGVRGAECKGLPIPEFFGDNAFEESKGSESPCFSVMRLDGGDKILEKTVIYLPEHKMYIAFLKDITRDELRKKELEEIQRTTFDTAQRVIDKQMRVAQEIASLLGETTAETKVALKKLVSSRDGSE